LHLLIELPTFEHTVLFQEKDPVPAVPSASVSNSLVTVLDPECGRDNPIETMQRKVHAYKRERAR